MRALSGLEHELALHAKFFSVGVFCGLVRVTEVAEWSETNFLQRASPPAWLLDIAFATKGNRLELVRDLDRIAERGGVRDLRVLDARSLLDRLANAIDYDTLSPRETEMALDWLVDNMPSNETLTEAIRGETSRFRVGTHRDGKFKNARDELRRWLERARHDPSATN